MLSLIAMIGRNRELGRDGKLLFHIPADMRYFKDVTMGHKVLMGRKTWDSLPGKLQGRTNIVVSRNYVPRADVFVSDLEQFIDENKDTDEEIFVIGGGMVYAEVLPNTKRLYLTEVYSDAPEADTWFPEFDKDNYKWEVLGKGVDKNIKYQFVKYERKENK